MIDVQVLLKAGTKPEEVSSPETDQAPQEAPKLKRFAPSLLLLGLASLHSGRAFIHAKCDFCLHRVIQVVPPSPEEATAALPVAMPLKMEAEQAPCMSGTI